MTLIPIQNLTRKRKLPSPPERDPSGKGDEKKKNGAASRPIRGWGRHIRPSIREKNKEAFRKKKKRKGGKLIHSTIWEDHEGK